MAEYWLIWWIWLAVFKVVPCRSAPEKPMYRASVQLPYVVQSEMGTASPPLSGMSDAAVLLTTWQLHGPSMARQACVTALHTPASGVAGAHMYSCVEAGCEWCVCTRWKTAPRRRCTPHHPR